MIAWFISAIANSNGKMNVKKIIFSCKNIFQERRKNIINEYNQQSQQETKIQTQKNCSAQQDKDLYSV